MRGRASQQHQPALARYEEIAADLAREVALERLKEGQRVYGRSLLAGKYNVSPETIRRAMVLLQDRGVVQVWPGTGIVVGSRSAAEAYLAQLGQSKLVQDMRHRLEELLKERDAINREIELLMDELLSYANRLAFRYHHIKEIRVDQNSALVGHTLAESGFRVRTGAMVFSIQRGGQEIFAPSGDTEIRQGDVLLVVASADSAGALFDIVKGKSEQQT